MPVEFGREQPRRLAHIVGMTAVIQRQAEHEGEAFFHFTHSRQAPLGRYEVHASDLIVRAEIAPVGARRPLLPPHLFASPGALSQLQYRFPDQTRFQTPQPRILVDSVYLKSVCFLWPRWSLTGLSQAQ